ncbi:MAG: helix-turn-helix domain-containing protein [Prevotella sp.]|nr:helix-turn-helix domain-containing protein [Prevotella sp.]
MIPRPRTILLIAYLLLSAVSLSAAVVEREFRVLNAANDLADNSAQVVTCTKTGRIIIATIGNLNFYDGSSFSHIDTHQEYQYQLPYYRGNYHLYFDHSHHLWLKNTHSVTCVDMTMERFIPDVEDVIRQMGCNDAVLDLFVDGAGQVWLLTEDGLYGTDQKQKYQVLRDRNLQDLEVMDSLLLAFYDNGEEMGIDLATGRVEHRTKAYDWVDAQKYVSSSTMIRYGKSFYQIRNGDQGSVLMRFDVPTHRWTKLMEMTYHLNNLAIEKGKLYIASEYGYWVYDLKSGEQTHVSSLKIIGSDQPLNTDCNTLAFDKQGGMWIGTERRGLLYARPYVSPFKVYSWEDKEAQEYGRMMDNLVQNIYEYDGKQANCVYIDSRNWTWYGTTTGLYLMRSPKEAPVLFDKKSGLLNNVVHSVIEDKRHNIWVSTSCGISCLLFEGDKVAFINSFNEQDNVPNESFINCKALCLADGTIVMQALDHVVAFQPKDLDVVNDRKPFLFYPKLVRMLVNGNFVEPGQALDGNVVIDRAITRAKDISLNADQNSVSLTFSGLNYFRPLQTYYRVRLPGLDDDYHVYSYFNGSGYVDEQGKLHLPLIGLKPGSFDIEVQASMFPDVWPGEPYVWTVHVNQPWWQSTGSYILLALIVLALLGVNFFLYNRNTRMRTRRNSEEGDIVRKICSFVDRCEALGKTPLSPATDAASHANADDRLDPDFVQLMLKLIPYVQDSKGEELTMHKLSQAGGIDVVKLYEISTPNLYKSPTGLVKLSRLEKAAHLLSSTEKPVEQIAAECGFYTPNYFIGSFFHQYKLTPREYRAKA